MKQNNEMAGASLQVIRKTRDRKAAQLLVAVLRASSLI